MIVTDNGCFIDCQSISSLLAEGSSNSQLCPQWSIHVRDSGVLVFWIWGVFICDLDNHRPEELHPEHMEATSCVLVCRLWLHPRCNWGLVLHVLWHYSRGPKLPVTALWVLNKKMRKWEQHLSMLLCSCVLGVPFKLNSYFLLGKEYSKGDSRYAM